MTDMPLVFSMPGHEALGARLAKALYIEEGAFTVRRFPDGGTYVRAETSCEGRDAILAINLFEPDAQFLPLIFAALALRIVGAERVILVSPYLPYMRQDARFSPGEVVTSRVFSQLISDTVDGLVTIDPHLHRYSSFKEIYSIPSRVEHAASSIAAWIHNEVHKPLIVGPDADSEQWVREVAEMAGAPFIVLSKKRRGDDVEVSVPTLQDRRGYTPVLVDAIISTAQTMIETAGHLSGAGYAAPICVGVHAVFADDAYENLMRAGVARVVTCNTVSHQSNEIDMTESLLQGIAEVLEEPNGQEVLP